MQCQVVHGGNEAFNAYTLRRPNMDFINWAKAKYDNLYNTVSGYSQDLRHTLSRAYNTFVGNEVLNRAQTILTQNTLKPLDQNVLHSIKDTDDIYKQNHQVRSYATYNPRYVRDVERQIVDEMLEQHKFTEDFDKIQETYGYQRVMDSVGYMDKRDDFLKVNYYSNGDETELSNTEKKIVLDIWRVYDLQATHNNLLKVLQHDCNPELYPKEPLEDIQRQQDDDDNEL